MENLVALTGVFLFWATLIWMPLTVARIFRTGGKPQIWTIAAVCAAVLVFLGYTRAMGSRDPAEAFDWSVAWLMPMGLILFARSGAGVPWKRLDIWLFFLTLFTFIPAAGLMRTLLPRVAALIW